MISTGLPATTWTSLSSWLSCLGTSHRWSLFRHHLTVQLRVRIDLHGPSARNRGPLLHSQRIACYNLGRFYCCALNAAFVVACAPFRGA